MFQYATYTLNRKAVNFFKKLKFKTFRDSLILYQTLEIKLLTDIWLNFRDMCYETYKLDPGHFSARGLAWDAFLKFPRISLARYFDNKYLIINSIDNRS